MTFPAASGVSDGDLIVLVAQSDARPGVNTAPSGFTTQGSIDEGTDARVWVYTKIASSESGTYTLILNSTSNWLANTIVVKGNDTSSPLDATTVSSNPAAATSQTTSSITTATANANLLILACCDPTSTGLSTTWSTATEIFDTNVGSTNWIAAAYEAKASPGSYTESLTLAASESITLHVLAIKPRALTQMAATIASVSTFGAVMAVERDGSFEIDGSSAFSASMTSNLSRGTSGVASSTSGRSSFGVASSASGRNE